MEDLLVLAGGYYALEGEWSEGVDCVRFVKMNKHYFDLLL